MQAELVGDFADGHGVGEILFVGEHKENSITQLIFLQHLAEFFIGLRDTFTIVGVNNEDKTLGVLEIVAPQGTDLVLTSDIPHGEADVLVLNSLNVETNGGNGGNDLTELELVQDGGLSGGIKTDHQDPHLLLSTEELGKNVPHLDFFFFTPKQVKKKKKKNLIHVTAIYGNINYTNNYSFSQRKTMWSPKIYPDENRTWYIKMGGLIFFFFFLSISLCVVFLFDHSPSKMSLRLEYGGFLTCLVEEEKMRSFLKEFSEQKFGSLAHQVGENCK